MNTEKQCFKCLEVKKLTEFYKHNGTEDGHLGKCKSCTKKDTSLRRDVLKLDENWCESERIRHREKYYRLNYLEKHKPTSEKKKAIMDRYCKKYPEKVKASKAISKFKKNKGMELHHWSYNDAHLVDIIELDYKIHALIHRYMKYDQNVKMYKDKLGNLLDTKDKHINYINYILSLDSK